MKENNHHPLAVKKANTTILTRPNPAGKQSKSGNAPSKASSKQSHDASYNRGLRVLGGSFVNPSQ